MSDNIVQFPQAMQPIRENIDLIIQQIIAEERILYEQINDELMARDILAIEAAEPRDAEIIQLEDYR